MAKHHLDLGGVVAARRNHALHDPHPEGGEAEFRVPHVIEQLLDGRVAGTERDDRREPATLAHDGDSGAIPEAGGHRAGLYRPG